VSPSVPLAVEATGGVGSFSAVDRRPPAFSVRTLSLSLSPLSYTWVLLLIFMGMVRTENTVCQKYKVCNEDISMEKKKKLPRRQGVDGRWFHFSEVYNRILMVTRAH
jgi:hypothetical protein